MLFFENDYSNGAHPEVLRHLCETNSSYQPGYGTDDFSQHAAELIREACCAPEADVFFLSGGTQTNAVVIGGMLRPWEGVVSAATGHVNVHEAGAIEYTAHKVLPLPQREGKLEAETLKAYLDTFFGDPNRDHMVFPGMVYISHPTEYGTLYSLQELEAISGVCRSRGIPLYLDGARLAYALGAGSAVTMPQLARLCDVFYIGGTKCGALCGEALVFPQGAPEHFLTVVKQRGALLAKGRVCGVQFEALFTDHLYERLGQQAVERAMELKAGLQARGYSLLMDSPTNQQFPIFPNAQLEKLQDLVRYSFWEPHGETETVIRLATSWSTTPEDVQKLMQVLDSLKAEET